MSHEHHTPHPSRIASRSAANNTPAGGISRPAVVQKKGDKLTFTEMSIHPPGNSNTIAEVTLDGQSLPQKWDNGKGPHAEQKIIQDLDSIYKRQLRKAKVMSLIINRAPCKNCAEGLVRLKEKYGIAIRVKATFISEEGNAGLRVLNANGIPFRIFTIDQREGLKDEQDKRAWKQRYKREDLQVHTEDDRLRNVTNRRDVTTTTKDLSTPEGRKAEELLNIQKAKDAGYRRAGRTWKEMGLSRSELEEVVEQQRADKRGKRKRNEGVSEEEQQDKEKGKEKVPPFKRSRKQHEKREEPEQKDGL